MKKYLRITLFVIFMMFSCAGRSGYVQFNADPNPDQAYILARLYLEANHDNSAIALRIVSEEKGYTYNLKFLEGDPDRILLFRVKPGSYKVKTIDYFDRSGKLTAADEFPGAGKTGETFSVAAGEIAYIGSCYGSVVTNFGYKNYYVSRLHDNSKADIKSFYELYPDIAGKFPINNIYE